jgi:hypothetical protein
MYIYIYIYTAAEGTVEAMADGAEAGGAEEAQGADKIVELGEDTQMS